MAQQPRIDSVAPSQGPISGGTIVTVRGANLGGSTVSLDRTAVTPLSRSDTEIRLQMPQHDNGYVVLSARSESGSAYGEFLYVPPRLDEIQPGWITTIAGVGAFTRDYGPALTATILPSGVAYDKGGRLYVADTGHDKIVRVNTDGTIERITAAEGSFAASGPALDVQVSFPLAVAVDSAGNVYIPDHFSRIRRVDPSGFMTTIAGDGTFGFSGDGGPASTARIALPTHMAGDDQDLFFVDFLNNRIRRIHFADGTISTFAGNGTAGFSGDGGAAPDAQFNLGDSDKGYLALDAAGNLYLADSLNNRIRKIDRRTGTISTIVRTGTRPDHRDDVGFPRSVAVDRSGAIYVGGGGGIVKFSAAGELLDSWSGRGYPADGSSARNAVGSLIVGLTIDAGGNIVYSSDGAVRRIDAGTDRITTIAGMGPALIGENGPAIASVFGPDGLALAPDGALLLGDTSLRLRRVDRNGIVSTVAGTGLNGGFTDGQPALKAVLAPVAVRVDSRGEIELTNVPQVYHIGADGIVRRIVGSNSTPELCAFSGDGGPALDAGICQVWDILRDRNQNLLIADSNNNRIRRVDATTGIISTIAGNGAPPNGYERYANGHSCGDGGPALTACLNTPYGLAYDADGNLFVACDRDIRKIDTNGIISTFASDLHTSKLVFDHGYLYTGVSGNIVRYDPAGNRTTLAGTFEIGHSGDGGPALGAKLTLPHQSAGIAIDAEGNLLFDTTTRIRAVRYGAVLPPPNATIRAIAAGSLIRATVFDAGGRPAPSVRVEFSAPASGASCSLSSSFAITDASGVATVSCTPNCIAGTYSVTAQPLTAVSTATIPLTNAGAPCRRRAVTH